MPSDQSFDAAQFIAGEFVKRYIEQIDANVFDPANADVPEKAKLAAGLYAKAYQAAKAVLITKLR